MTDHRRGGGRYAERSWLDAVLGPGPEWRVVRVERTRAPKELRAGVERAPGSRLRRPDCNEECPGCDTRRREWRSLDARGYKTFLVCDVPRVRCREHGVLTMQVPWAEGSSRYTAQFEAEVIRWLKEASVQAVAGRMRPSWNGGVEPGDGPGAACRPRAGQGGARGVLRGAGRDAEGGPSRASAWTCGHRTSRRPST